VGVIPSAVLGVPSDLLADLIRRQSLGHFTGPLQRPSAYGCEAGRPLSSDVPSVVVRGRKSKRRHRGAWAVTRLAPSETLAFR
jgi:hypothetical protein